MLSILVLKSLAKISSNVLKLLHSRASTGNSSKNMTYSLISSFIVFCFVSAITPGPNNLMLLASGANFGIRKTLPHMFGVVLGFSFMIIVIGFGLAQVFDIFPALYTILKFIAVIYLLYLSYKIATTKSKIISEKSTSTPITFLQAVIFQWVNPKAWTMALAAIAVYTPQPITNSHIIFVSLVFGIIILMSINVWLLLGVQIRHFLTTAARLRTFNFAMAFLLILSLYPIITL